MKRTHLLFIAFLFSGCSQPASPPPVENRPEAIGRLQAYGAFPEVNGRFVERVANKEFELKTSDYTEMGVWTSRLLVTDQKTGKSCTVSYHDKIVDIYVSPEAKVLLVPHYARDDKRHSVAILDTDRCKEKYTLSTTRNGPDIVSQLRVANNRITITPDCTCTKNGECLCTAARVYSLDEDNRPVLQEQESQNLMDALLTGELKGKRWSIKATPAMDMLKAY